MFVRRIKIETGREGKRKKGGRFKGAERHTKKQSWRLSFRAFVDSFFRVMVKRVHLLLACMPRESLVPRREQSKDGREREGLWFL